MKAKILNILLILSAIVATNTSNAQEFADKEYYIIDSLDLSKLSSFEIKHLDSALINYHQAKDDTSKLNAINPYIQVSLDDAVWPKYNEWVHNFTLEKLKNKNSIKVETKLKEYLASSFNDFGYLYSSHGNSLGALKNYTKSLEIQQEIGDKEGIATSYNNLAIVYSDQGNDEKSLEYLLKSLELHEEIGNKEGLAVTINNVGNAYFSNDEIEKALEYFKKGLQLSIELNDKSVIGSSLNQIGDLYYSQKKYKEALDHYEKSLKIREEINDLSGISGTLNSLGAYFLDNGKLRKAKKYAERSLNVSNELGYPSTIESSSRLLYKIYVQMENYEGALEMYKLSIQMGDSLDSKATQKLMVEEQAKIEHEKVEAIQKAEHEKQLAIEKEEKEKQKIITYAIGGGLLLVIAFSIFVFNRLKISNRQKKQIEKQSHQLLEVNEELNQYNEEILAQRDLIDEQKKVVEKSHNEVKASINYAKRIQTALLTTDEHWQAISPEHFILFKPRDVVSGDFFWAYCQNDIAIWVAADCTGHGVPGAFMSMLGVGFLNEIISETGLTEASKILDKLRTKIINSLEQKGVDTQQKDGMDIALCVWNKKTNKLQYAGAFNPLYHIRNGELTELKGDKQPIGKHNKEDMPFTTQEIKLEKGDTIYTFSDGYVDQFGGPKARKFLSKNFKTLLLSLQDRSMPDQRDILDTTIENWMKEANSIQIDDICVVGVKV